jgi:hypothetical protein
MVEKVCGVDVHRGLLVATILDVQTQDKQNSATETVLTT